jgi:ubiquinone biosynthesis protein UbiJ
MPPSATPSNTADVNVGEIAALKANVARLEADVEALKSLVGKLCSELGVSG